MSPPASDGTGLYWLASYMKSGNTWFRVWLENLRAADMAAVSIDALDTPIASSRTWIDSVLGFDSADLDFDEVDRLRAAVYAWRADAAAVGYHKIHDAYTRTALGAPVFGGDGVLGAVYIVRNPLDIAPSYAAHRGEPIDRVIDLMADPDHAHSAHTDGLDQQVRQTFLDWSGHVASWLDAVDLSVHPIRYEDMHAAPAATLTAAATFLGLPHDPNRIARAVHHGQFERLRAQERASGFAERPPGMSAFFRSGRTGSWRDHLSTSQVRRIIRDHAPTMRRLGYLNFDGDPV